MGWRCFKFIIVLCYVCVICALCITAWRSEDSFVGLVFFFHLCAGSGDQTQVTRRVSKHPLPTETLLPPWNFYVSVSLRHKTTINKQTKPTLLTWFLEAGDFCFFPTSCTEAYLCILSKDGHFICPINGKYVTIKIMFPRSGIKGHSGLCYYLSFKYTCNYFNSYTEENLKYFFLQLLQYYYMAILGPEKFFF